MYLTDLEYEREPHRTGKNQAIQKALCGFLLDEVINPKGEFHSDPRISVARAEQKKRRNNDDDD